MHEAAEWLFAHAEYDHDEQTQLLKSRANLVGAFIDGKAVCAGYSRAAAYCLLRAGYSAAYCVGEAGGVCHAWNAYVDSTGRLVFADVTYAVTANDVYSGLCLNNWLYGEEDRTFRRFSMAALQSTEDLMMAERLARSMCREIEKPIS